VIEARRDPNRSFYERPAAVREWAAKRELEPPERSLLALLGPVLPGLRMLDIGVGAGRTTAHFAPRVREYTGVDYSRPLIAACQARFGGRPGWTFRHGDARSMPFLPDAGFDLVLFSVNGLDCLDHRGRLAALAEVARVCRPEGLFFFSSHNLDAVRLALSVRRLARDLRATRAPGRFALSLGRRVPPQLLARLANPPAGSLVARDWAWISQGWPPGSACGTYHAKPGEVDRQVRAAGFTLERVFLPSGAEVGYRESLGRAQDLWLNYLCRRAAAAPGRA
jgi:SAM-dependent methyltransferase